MTATNAQDENSINHDRRQALLLPVPEAARLLGIGTTLCWEMVHGGQLPSVRFGRRVLIPRAAIERLALTSGASQLR